MVLLGPPRRGEVLEILDVAPRQEALHELFDAVDAGEDDPAKDAAVAGRVERGQVLSRSDADRRQRHHVGPELLQCPNQLARLLPGARHDNAAAEQRPGVEPAQVLAEVRDRADHQQGSGPSMAR